MQHLCLEKGYKSIEEEQELIKRGYVLHIPTKKKKGEDKVDKGRTKNKTPNRRRYSANTWVVEQTNSWHNRFRKLFSRYVRMAENYLGLVRLACCMIIYGKIILG